MKYSGIDLHSNNCLVQGNRMNAVGFAGPLHEAAVGYA
jgi:hypothetical protein